MTKKVLITGVSGFLGAALWEYFRAKQSFFKVFGVDRHASLSSRQVFLCDLNNQKETSGIVTHLKPDYIFHLAGGRMYNEKDLFKNNVLATKSLFEVIAEINDYRPRIIIPGSAAEYGKTMPATKPIKETVHARPILFYGFAKNMQTELGLMYARAGLDIIVARIFNVSGYGMPPTLSLGQFSKQIALIEKSKRRPVIHTGNLGMKRDFLDIKDVCSALLAIARKGKSGEIYNICSGKSYVMRDLLEELISYTQVDNIAIKEDKKGTRGMDVSIGSYEKIKKTTGWKPKVGMSQSLKNTLSYYQELFAKNRI